MKEEEGNMRELIELLTRALVDEPDQVEVREIDEGDATLLEIRVAPNDIGKVIGKQGRTIKAMRTLIHAASIKSQKRVLLEMADDRHHQAPAGEGNGGPENPA
jgi:predicted RNA-binding protein YlqC (UPF0109 family)